MIERMDWIEALDPAPLVTRLGLAPGEPLLVVLPGSRVSEVSRLMQPFGDAVARLHQMGQAPRVVIPAMPHVRRGIEAAAADWPIAPTLLDGEEDKFRAFKLARAALAASGTVTLELGIAGGADGGRLPGRPGRDPAAAPRQGALDRARQSGRRAETRFPNSSRTTATARRWLPPLAPLLADTPERAAQLAALAAIPRKLRLPSGTPSEAAASIVLAQAERRAQRHLSDFRSLSARSTSSALPSAATRNSP